MLRELRDLGVTDRNDDGVVDTVHARIYVADDASLEELVAAANLAARLAFESVSMNLPIGFCASEYTPDDAIAIFVGSAAAKLRGPRIVALPDIDECETLACSIGLNDYSPVDAGPPTSTSLENFTLANALKSAQHVIVGPRVQATALIDLAARIGLESTSLRLPLVTLALEPVSASPPPRSILIGLSNPHVRQWIESGRFSPDLQEGTGCVSIVGPCIVVAGADRVGEEAAMRHCALRLPYLRNYGKGNPSISNLENDVRDYCPSPVPATHRILDQTFSFEWEVSEARHRIRESFLPAIQLGSAAELELRLSEHLEVRQAFAMEIREMLQEAGANLPASSIRVLCAHKQGFFWIAEELLAGLNGAARIVIRFRELECRPDSVDVRDRWLHELYPIDEILARDLGLRAEQITFERVPPSAPHVYEVIAEDGDGKTFLRASFNPTFVTRPMFDIFPDYASASVATGWIRASVDGKLSLDERITTDYESFWDQYQSKTLPQIRDYVLGLHGGMPKPESTPHFDELVVEVELSEPDFRLGIDEERISTLEALHEDLYFETLLFFEVLGVATCGKPLRYPGRIVPRIHPARGGPGRAKVRLTGYHTPFPSDKPFADLNPLVTQLTVNVDGATSAEILAGTRFSWLLSKIPDPPAMIARDAGTQPIVQWDEPIGPEECERILTTLSSFPEVRCFPAGRSWLGRTIWAMDVRARHEGTYFSQAKAAATKPCLFISGRQHANEVSSTSHILKLVELLVTRPEYRKLLDRVDFVIHPMTNPDGAALVEDLHRLTPDFMLHAGYLGALGVDVTEGQWSNAPKYPEARIRVELWRMCQPDIVLNPHGYPSHEWVQLFAGYTAWVKSKRVQARDWWIPRGWFIPRFDFIEDLRFPEHHRAAFELRNRISESVHRTFGAINERMYRRYAKYTGASLELHQRVLIQSHGCGSAAHPGAIGFMSRYPETTFFEGLSEAPDEVASGEWLKTLAGAGLEFSLVHARFLAQLPNGVRRTRWKQDGATVLQISRQRLRDC